MGDTYVHGYDAAENRRLQDQAATLADLLHADTHYPAGSRVLEAGCGVGAQTTILASKNLGASFTSIDISQASLDRAREAVAEAGLTNVDFSRADIFDLPFPARSFDHAFVCFVLEHLDRPVEALARVSRVLKPGGTLTVIEGDHGSTFFYPRSVYAERAVQCQVELQARANGDAMIGRALYPVLAEAGFDRIRVSPRMVYTDASKPAFVEGFTRRTFTAMIAGIRSQSVASNLMTGIDFDRGLADLARTASDDGVFCYTFFKATAIKPA